MQETTFNSACNEKIDLPLISVREFLHNLYSELMASQNRSLLTTAQIMSVKSIENLQNELGHTFKNKELLISALTHTTFKYEYADLKTNHNERLEFLGDSIINLLVGKKLFSIYPTAKEGELSRLRGALVNESTFAKLAQIVHLGDNLFLGKGEFKNNGHLKSSILSDAFESLFAALYLDLEEDLKKVEKCFEKVIVKFNQENNLDFYSFEQLDTFDSKTKLQELMMAKFSSHPVYKCAELDNGFKVEIWLDTKKIIEGFGNSKKKLEKELAQKILDEKLYLD